MPFYVIHGCFSFSTAASWVVATLYNLQNLKHLLLCPLRKVYQLFSRSFLFFFSLFFNFSFTFRNAIYLELIRIYFCVCCDKRSRFVVGLFFPTRLSNSPAELIRKNNPFPTLWQHHLCHESEDLYVRLCFWTLSTDLLLSVLTLILLYLKVYGFMTGVIFCNAYPPKDL